MNDGRLVPGSLLLLCCLVIVYWTADGRVLGGLPWRFKGEITLCACVRVRVRERENIELL